jgi:hypothetical protein
MMYFSMDTVMIFNRPFVFVANDCVEVVSKWASKFKQPLETHWQAYLDGKVSREAALREILIETTSVKE